MKIVLPLFIFSVFLTGCGGQETANRQTETNSTVQGVSINSNAQKPSDVTVTTRTPSVSGNSDAPVAPGANKKKRDVSYLPKIEFVDSNLGKTEKGEDGIVGEVKNTGDKAVKVLSIRAVYLNEQGVKLSESDFPVIYENAAEDDSKRPLKPNESRKFSFKIDAPPNWTNQFKLYVMEADTEN